MSRRSECHLFQIGRWKSTRSPGVRGGAASLTGRAGFGDAALEEGAVAVVAVDPFSFLGALASALG